MSSDTSQPEPALSEDEREVLGAILSRARVLTGIWIGTTVSEILAAGFHRTKPEKPQPDHAALVAEARGVVNLAESFGASDKVVKLVARLTDALEGKPHGT